MFQRLFNDTELSHLMQGYIDENDIDEGYRVFVGDLEDDYGMEQADESMEEECQEEDEEEAMAEDEEEAAASE